MGGHLPRVRISGDGKAVEKWQAHLDTLARRMERLNALDLKSLHYTNSLGTDLTVELPEGCVWEAGNDETLSGVPSSPTSPRRRSSPLL